MTITTKEALELAEQHETGTDEMDRHVFSDEDLAAMLADLEQQVVQRLESQSETRVKQLERDAAAAGAYKWAYEYLQDRMRSIGRDGWAEDCDGEIQYRIDAVRAKAHEVTGDPPADDASSTRHSTPGDR